MAWDPGVKKRKRERKAKKAGRRVAAKRARRKANNNLICTKEQTKPCKHSIFVSNNKIINFLTQSCFFHCNLEMFEKSNGEQDEIKIEISDAIR